MTKKLLFYSKNCKHSFFWLSDDKFYYLDNSTIHNKGSWTLSELSKEGFLFQCFPKELLINE